MSHEIRTPMNAVLGFAGLGMRLDVSAKAREYFRKINNSGQNLLNILNDILDFSKIEAGKLALETVPFALSDVLAQVSDLFAIKASEKSLEFVVGTAPDVPDHYIGDPLRLGQVLLNLVNNAIKFTRAGFVQLYVERAETQRRRRQDAAAFFGGGFRHRHVRIADSRICSSRFRRPIIPRRARSAAPALG